MRISKTVMAVGGVVIALVVIIGFTNPKAVHAVTAALVQVTNTASNPAVTQSVGAQAGNMVHLSCSFAMEKVNSSCFQVSPDGSTTPDYMVPAGKSLVVTAVDLDANPLGGLCGGDYAVNLGTPSNNGAYLNLVAPSSILTAHYTYTSGLVIGGGITPTLWGASESISGLSNCSSLEAVTITGYLTTP